MKNYKKFQIKSVLNKVTTSAMAYVFVFEAQISNAIVEKTKLDTAVHTGSFSCENGKFFNRYEEKINDNLKIKQ